MISPLLRINSKKTELSACFFNLDELSWSELILAKTEANVRIVCVVSLANWRSDMLLIHS